MSIFSSLLGAAAPIVGSIFGGPVGGAIGGAVGGLLGGSSKPSGTTTATTQQTLDPRIQSMLFGQNGSGGMLDQYQKLGQAPQDPRLANYGSANLNYLSNASDDMGQIRNTANGLLTGQAVPKVQATGQAPLAYMQGSQVNAPSQNGLDLKGSYDGFINGDRGANPFLTGAIQKGINQSSNAFGNYLSDAKNATQDMLGSIRGGAQMAGGYGGSRQGLAEGKAIESMNTQLGRAASQFGQNNTDAAVAAQSGAYESDSNRALAATQGLGAQQYGVASQNANIANNAEAMNVNRTNDVNADWARRDQQAQQANQSATMQGQTIGAGLLSGQMAGAAGAGTNQDNFALNRATQTNGLLAPYMSANSGSTSSQPLYQNQGGNLLGGAMAGLGLYNQMQTPKPPVGGTGIMSAFGTSY